MIINGEERELNKIKIPKGTDVKSYFEEKVNQGEYEFCLELLVNNSGRYALLD